jgi:hypothetical protein
MRGDRRAKQIGRRPRDELTASHGTVPRSIVCHAGVRGEPDDHHRKNALLGFGLHGFGHIGISVLTHGYTSGVATSPTIVIPFWLWATQVLNQAGVPNRRSIPAAIALAAGSIASGHLVAFLLTGNRP